MKYLIPVAKYIIFTFLLAKIMFQFTTRFALSSTYESEYSFSQMLSLEYGILIGITLATTILTFLLIKILSIYVKGEFNVIIVSVISHIYFMSTLIQSVDRFKLVRGIITFSILYLILLMIIKMVNYVTNK